MIPALILAASGAGVLASSLAKKTQSAVQETLKVGGGVPLSTTTYWPYTAKDNEKAMEGVPLDTKEKPLITLEQHLSNPSKYPYVSLAGDPKIWPYGQAIKLPAIGPNVIGRVVDTGGHFKGRRKIVRVAGQEPVDVCVGKKSFKLPENMIGYIVAGDNFAGGEDVAMSKFGVPVKKKKAKEEVSGDLAAVQAALNTTLGLIQGTAASASDNVSFTITDCEALARAIESCCQKGTLAEKQAVGWACKNRAVYLGQSIAETLCPDGTCGPQGSGGRDFVSTRLPASLESTAVAKAVLISSPGADPTRGALDFWRPEEQDVWKQKGDEFRTAADVGDEATVELYGDYAHHTISAQDVRKAFAMCGLVPCARVGSFELLSRAV